MKQIQKCINNLSKIYNKNKTSPVKLKKKLFFIFKFKCNNIQFKIKKNNRSLNRNSSFDDPFDQINNKTVIYNIN